MTNTAIARATGVHPSTVGRWLAMPALAAATPSGSQILKPSSTTESDVTSDQQPAQLPAKNQGSWAVCCPHSSPALR